MAEQRALRRAKLKARMDCAVVSGKAVGAAKRILKLPTAAGSLGRLFDIREGKLFTSIGLLPRIRDGLRASHWDVQIEGDPAKTFYQGTAPSGGGDSGRTEESTHRLAKAITSNVCGQIRVSDGSCIPSYGLDIAAYLQDFKQHNRVTKLPMRGARVFHACRNKKRVKQRTEQYRSSESLRREKGLPRICVVSAEKDFNWFEPGVFVGTTQQAAGLPARDWNVLLYDEPAVVLTKTMLQWPAESREMARYCFVVEPARFCLEDQLFLEFTCGPEIFSDVPTTPNRVCARFVDSPHILGVQTADSLESKRTWLWQNELRNQAIAELALALAEGKRSYLHRQSAITSIECDYWFGHPDYELTVGVLVESLEHAREIQLHLPGWPISRSTGQRISSHAIYTWNHVQTNAIVKNAVIRADGIESFAIDPNKFSSDELEPMMLFDIADRSQRGDTKSTVSRRKTYEQLGWH